MITHLSQSLTHDGTDVLQMSLKLPPWMKLPSFYLLDAVSKNVYDPYARHFDSVVTSLFLNSCGLVKPSVRSRRKCF